MEDDIAKIMEEMEHEDYEVFEKEVTQLEKAQPVSKAIQDMASFYKMIMTKLSSDGYCYLTKRKLEKGEQFDVIRVPDNKVEPGMIAFVAVAKSENTEKADKK